MNTTATTGAISICLGRVFDILAQQFPSFFRLLYSPDDLILHGDIGHDQEQQFANEARMALRLANFLSAFLQVGKNT